MISDIAGAGGTEQGVADRVDQHVGVRVTFQAPVKVDDNPAENHFLSRNKAVNVVSDADFHGPSRRYRSKPMPKIARFPRRPVACRGYYHIGFFP
jgi:hypothetical protein